MKRKSKTLKITRAGQITLPKEIREKYKILEGDLLEFTETPEGFVFRPVETNYKRLTMPDLIERTDTELKNGQYTVLNNNDEIEDFINGL